MARQNPFMHTATSRGSSAAVFLCTASLSCLIMWLPVGLPMIESLGAGLLGAMLLGVLLARVVGSVKFNSIAPVIVFAACSVTSMWLSPLSEISSSKRQRQYPAPPEADMLTPTSFAIPTPTS